MLWHCTLILFIYLFFLEGGQYHSVSHQHTMLILSIAHFYYRVQLRCSVRPCTLLKELASKNYLHSHQLQAPVRAPVCLCCSFILQHWAFHLWVLWPPNIIHEPMNTLHYSCMSLGWVSPLHTLPHGFHMPSSPSHTLTPPLPHICTATFPISYYLTMCALERYIIMSLCIFVHNIPTIYPEGGAHAHC